MIRLNAKMYGWSRNNVMSYADADIVLPLTFRAEQSRMALSIPSSKSLYDTINLLCFSR